MTVRSWLRPPITSGKKIDGRIDAKTAKWIAEKIGKQIGGKTGVRTHGLMLVVHCEGSIVPIMSPASMAEKAGRMLVPPRWIARTGRKEWTVLTNSTGRRDRTDLRGLTGQIGWNDRNVRIDLIGRSVRNGQNDRNGRTNRSGPAGTNTAGG